MYVYEENEQEIAYFLTMENVENKNILIIHLAVIEKYRGKGVGKRFIEEIKEFFMIIKLS